MASLRSSGHDYAVGVASDLNWQPSRPDPFVQEQALRRESLTWW